MATMITDDCISCGACEPQCPNQAISQDLELCRFIIDPDKCTECVGHFAMEQCQSVCPVDCCIPDPQNIEAEDVLFARAKVVHPETTFPLELTPTFSLKRRQTTAP